MKKIILLITCILLSRELAWSQAQVRTQTPTWRRSTAIVLFAGIAGGILGLSTLSFYGDPKEHTSNVTIGAMLGLVAGGGYLVYDSVPHQAPRRNYDYYGLFESPDAQIKKPTQIASVPKFTFEFSF